MKISVCMATYNGEEFIMDQLDSILSQLSAQDEVIISDDGSTDRTVDIINGINDPRIKLFHSNKKNVVLNFENALKHASGDIIFLSDQDDVWTSNKVLACQEHLNDHLLVISNAYVVKSYPTGEYKFMFNGTKKRNGFWKNFYKNNYTGATMAFHADLLDKALPFPAKLPMHDVWLGLLADIYGKTFYIDQPLIYYRRHAETASTTTEKSSNSILEMIWIRLSLLRFLIKRILNKGLTTKK